MLPATKINPGVMQMGMALGCKSHWGSLGPPPRQLPSHLHCPLEVGSSPPSHLRSWPQHFLPPLSPCSQSSPSFDSTLSLSVDSPLSALEHTCTWPAPEGAYEASGDYHAEGSPFLREYSSRILSQILRLMSLVEENSSTTMCTSEWSRKWTKETRQDKTEVSSN